MKKQIIVTTSWDDGYKKDLKLAKLLRKYKIAGTFYISREKEDKKVLLTEKDIKNLSNDFEIGAHTMKHYHLTKVPLSKAIKDIKNSKNYLEKITGKKIYSFCYPYGEHNLKIEKLVSNLGFKLARTVERFNISKPRNKFALATTVHAYTHLKDRANLKILSKYKTNDWEILAKKQFDFVLKEGGVYHLWGHSWEIDKFKQWEKLERVFKYIANKKDIKYLDNFGVIK